MYARMIRIALTAILVGFGTLAVAAPASAATVTDTDTAGIVYAADDQNPDAGATVTGYTGAPGTVTIPATITIDGTDYPVTTIGDDAFYHRGLKTVTIPDSVLTIDDGAFADNELAAVVIPDSVTTIGYYAFAQNALTSVTISDSVITISEGAFSDNDLRSVVIPDSVTTIGHSAFFDNDLMSVEISGSVTTIDQGAFSYNSLTSVVIPGSVTMIGINAFSYNSLTSVTIPDSVTTIGYSAFYENDVTTVTIPDSVTTISSLAFAFNDLTSVTIPGSVTTIGYDAFSFNDGLTSVSFTGAPPATFIDAGDDGSLGSGDGLVISYPWAYHDSNIAGGFTSPTWRGYDTRAITTVTFNLGGHGAAIPGLGVIHGQAVAPPVDPAATGWTFTGWHTDAETTTVYDFSAPVTDDLVLYAGWASAALLANTGSPLTGPLLAVALTATIAGAILTRRRTA